MLIKLDVFQKSFLTKSGPQGNQPGSQFSAGGRVSQPGSPVLVGILREASPGPCQWPVARGGKPQVPGMRGKLVPVGGRKAYSCIKFCALGL